MIIELLTKVQLDEESPIPANGDPKPQLFGQISPSSWTQHSSIILLNGWLSTATSRAYLVSCMNSIQQYAHQHDVVWSGRHGRSFGILLVFGMLLIESISHCLFWYILECHISRSSFAKHSRWGCSADQALRLTRSPFLASEEDGLPSGSLSRAAQIWHCTIDISILKHILEYWQIRRFGYDVSPPLETKCEVLTTSCSKVSLVEWSWHLISSRSTTLQAPRIRACLEPSSLFMILAVSLVQLLPSGLVRFLVASKDPKHKSYPFALFSSHTQLLAGSETLPDVVHIHLRFWGALWLIHTVYFFLANEENQKNRACWNYYCSSYPLPRNSPS